MVLEETRCTNTEFRCLKVPDMATNATTEEESDASTDQTTLWNYGQFAAERADVTCALPRQETNQ